MSPRYIICFGQQPNGFFPKGFFVDKVITARELQAKVGGKIVWFCHDSDHDYRETITKIKTDRYPQGFVRLNINQPSKFEKLFTPLYLKQIKEGWQEETANKLEPIVPKEAWESFKSIPVKPTPRPSQEGTRMVNSPPLEGSPKAGVGIDNVADFCIAMYRGMRLLDGITLVRSSDFDVRRRAFDLTQQEHFLDIKYKGVIVHARRSDDGYFLDHGGNVKEFIPPELIPDQLIPAKLSPTRLNRFAWMQSVTHCTHYIYGKSEEEYLDFKSFPEVTFIPRQQTHEPHYAVSAPV